MNALTNVIFIYPDESRRSPYNKSPFSTCANLIPLNFKTCTNANDLGGQHEWFNHYNISTFSQFF